MPNRTIVASVALPLTAAVIAVLIPFLILGAATSAAVPLGCGGAGTAQTVANVHVTAEQMDNASIIVAVAAGRRLPARAAVIAVAVAYAESKLVNSSAETDHDSEGLFQQRVSIYTKAVADDPVRATNAFLDRLVRGPSWQTGPLGGAAQVVQHSQPGAGLYAPTEPLASALVGQLWPAASAAAADSSAATGAAAQPVLMCATGALLSSAAVNWLLFFADHGWNVPYQNCPAECRSITGVHSCYHAYTDRCRLTREDCSGFVRWVFWNALHIDIGPDGNAQLRQGRARHWPVHVTRDIQGDWRTMGVQVGDIVFFGVGAGTAVYGNGTISPDPNVAGTSHVAIYAGNGQVVENGGNTWRGYHPLYNQGDYQYVMRPALPATS
jgi:cell wall-associated NlpC family hydrolase